MNSIKFVLLVVLTSPVCFYAQAEGNKSAPRKPAETAPAAPAATPPPANAQAAAPSAAAATTAKPAEKTADGEEAPASDPSGAEEADIQKIKEKYWARGQEAEVAVVQNRIFTKRRKPELDVNFGSLVGDPFLSTTTLSGSLGYHFNEDWSAHLTYAKAFVNGSSALETLESQLATTANTNQVKWLALGEGRFSLIYGKVSLVGYSILYFDAYLTAGGGVISTESGDNPFIIGGVGQQIHVSKYFGINLSYKILRYSETILGKITGVNGNLGQSLGSRSNLSSWLNVGLTVLLDPIFDGSKKKAK